MLTITNNRKPGGIDTSDAAQRRSLSFVQSNDEGATLSEQAEWQPPLNTWLVVWRDGVQQHPDSKAARAAASDDAVIVHVYRDWLGTSHAQVLRDATTERTHAESVAESWRETAAAILSADSDALADHLGKLTEPSDDA